MILHVHTLHGCLFCSLETVFIGLSSLQDGATPLHYAVQVGAMQTVKLLIKYNVDVNIADNVRVQIHKSILFYIVSRGPSYSRSIFLSQEGWTALHVAVQSRNRNIVKVLLINGADKSRRNKVIIYLYSFIKIVAFLNPFLY